MPLLAVSKQHFSATGLQFQLHSGDATLGPVSTDEGSFARQTATRAVETLTTTLRGPQRPLTALTALRHAQWLTSHAETFWIDAARREGATWEQIATARSTSHQNESAAGRRRAAEAARDPFDRWLDRLRAAQAREQRRRAKEPGTPLGSTGVT
jgi:hypothetical protein